MKILLATDGSDSANAAVDFLVGFPFPPGSEVMVLAVLHAVLHPEELGVLSEAHREIFEHTRREEEKEAQQLLSSVVGRLRDAGWAGSTTVRTGHPADEILAAADEIGADLIVVGSHGLTGVRKFLLGSVSDHVLGAASCSVLIVKSGVSDSDARTVGGGQPWRILLAYDDSSAARKAAELCASLPLSGKAEIRAVSVLPMIRMFRQDIRQQMNWIWQQKKEASRTALDGVVERLRQSGADVSGELIESADVAQAILVAAAGFDSELVVIGHKGKRATQKFLLGSSTSRIAHHATCSVLAVKGRLSD